MLLPGSFTIRDAYSTIVTLVEWCLLWKHSYVQVTLQKASASDFVIAAQGFGLSSEHLASLAQTHAIKALSAACAGCHVRSRCKGALHTYSACNGQVSLDPQPRRRTGVDIVVQGFLHGRNSEQEGRCAHHPLPLHS